jgi:D-tyrosyl-tRNA(Tyr) deacylase
MRLVLQKVSKASVEVEHKIVGEISRGLLLFLAVKTGDNTKDADWLVEKVLKLRIFSDNENTFMQKNIVDAKGEVLVISQFTLYGDCKKGTKPSFTESASPKEAKNLYDYFVEKICQKIKTQTGKFGAHMNVSLKNDGPITLIIDSKAS